MWGKVVEHDGGYRAEFAYPTRLRLLCNLCGDAGGLDSMVVRELPEQPGKLGAVCPRHRGRRRGKGWPAREIQAELLSTYGVDLLPEAAVRELRGRWSSGAAPRARAAHLRSSVRQALAMAIAIFPAMFVSLWMLVGLLGRGAGATALAQSVKSAPGGVVSSSGAFSASSPKPGDMGRASVPRITFVCAVAHAGWAHPVPCTGPRRDLVGIAYKPPGPRRWCGPNASYTRRPGFSVCWAPVIGSGRPVAVGPELRLPRVSWRDLDGKWGGLGA